MSVEFLNAFRAKGSSVREYSVGSHWAKRKAVHRAKRSSLIANPTSAAPTPSNPGQSDLTDTSFAERSGSRPPPSAPSRISAEWIGATGGPPAEVVLRIHPPSGGTPRGNLSSLPDTGGSGVVVRAEEALIVAFVLLLWVAAIALFFNRWGKIRCVYKLMLEPYQPKFQQQHRTSCALAESTISVPPHHRASLSRGCVSYDYGGAFPAYQPCGHLALRPRQNSVFVGSVGAMALIPESPPRRSRSAADLPALSPGGDLAPLPAPRASRASSLHSAVDLRLHVPAHSPRACSLDHSAIQVHVAGGNANRPRSPRRLTVTNV